MILANPSWIPIFNIEKYAISAIPAEGKNKLNFEYAKPVFPNAFFPQYVEQLTRGIAYGFFESGYLTAIPKDF